VRVASKGKAKDGVKYKAHFEHLKRNPDCRYGVGVKISQSSVQTSEQDRQRL
jgi:hypothetical protein